MTINVSVGEGNSKDHHPQSNSDHGSHSFSYIRPLLGTFGVFIGFLAIALFWWRRAQHSSEKAQDYRAIAEGLRVQSFWNLAGLGRSVPANYMHRQRTEFDWIRGVIRTASMPYDHWRDRFNRLSELHQVIAIRCVLQNWVRKQETDYYDAKIHEKQYVMHSWHKLGGVLALTGLCGFSMLAFLSWFNSHHPLAWFQPRWWFGVLLTLILSLLVAVVSMFRGGRHARDKFTSQHHPPKLNEKGIVNKNIVRLFRWINVMLRTTDPHPTQYFPLRQERIRMLLNFLNYLLLALTLAVLAMTSSAIISQLWTTSPNATIWTSVASGVYLVVGALCVAWTEKQLDSEIAYQYSTMAPLFRAARLRLEPLMKTLSEQAGLTSQEEGKEEYQATLKEIRAVLYELGMEALDENAEWLILHRARPLEPVMAG